MGLPPQPLIYPLKIAYQRADFIAAILQLNRHFMPENVLKCPKNKELFGIFIRRKVLLYNGLWEMLLEILSG
jgi:hypothetical protein